VNDVAQVVAGVELVWAAASDPGRQRPVNEDSVLGGAPVFVVADGMGGHDAGDRASAAVVGAFARHVAASGPTTIDAIRRALEAADTDVRALGATTRRGAGSTVTGVALVEHLGQPHWLVFNIGDSRVYRHAGAVFEQLTVDHSLAQEMVAARRLRPEDVAQFADRNVITRAIGSRDATADSWLLPVVTGDRLLLCSDGLYRELADESLRAALTMAGRPSGAVDALVRLANQAGGRDNITVVVVDVRAGGVPGGAELETTASATPIWALADDDDTLAVQR
jgi:protein phosphatase